MAIQFLDCDCPQNILENLNRVMAAVNGVLPEVTEDDEGKVLAVVDGEWAAYAAPEPEE